MGKHVPEAKGGGQACAAAPSTGGRRLGAVGRRPVCGWALLLALPVRRQRHRLAAPAPHQRVKAGPICTGEVAPSGSRGVGGRLCSGRPVTCQAPGQVFHGRVPVTLTRAVNTFCRKGSNCPTILSQEGNLGPGLPNRGPPSLGPRDLEAAKPGSQQVGPGRPRPGFGVMMPHSLGSPPPWDGRLGFLSSGGPLETAKNPGQLDQKPLTALSVQGF